MTRRLVVLACVPLAVIATVALPLGLWKGEYQWLFAGVAAALVVPAGVLTMFAAERLGRSSVYGPLLALVVGAFGRVFIGFGGAAAVYLLNKPTFERDPVSYLAWVLGAYLTTLLTETVLLARKRPGGTTSPTEPPKA